MVLVVLVGSPIPEEVEPMQLGLTSLSPEKRDRCRRSYSGNIEDCRVSSCPDKFSAADVKHIKLFLLDQNWQKPVGHTVETFIVKFWLEVIFMEEL